MGAIRQSSSYLKFYSCSLSSTSSHHFTTIYLYVSIFT